MTPDEPVDAADGRGRSNGWSLTQALSAVGFLFCAFLIGYQVSWWWLLGALVVVVTLAAIVIPPLETTRAFIDYFKWLLVLGAWVVTYVLLDNFRPIGPEFYSVAAQIIPVLLLAVALEARMFTRFYDKGDLWTALIVVYALAAGEFEALRSIANEGTDSSAAPVVGAAIAAGFTGVVVGALGSAFPDLMNDE